MEIRPILSAMLRNKTGAVLVALQIALTLAVVANALFIIDQRLTKIGRPSGMDTDNLFFVQSYGFAPGYQHQQTVRRDLDLIRSSPGVIDATPISAIPLSNGGSTTDYRVQPEDQGTDQEVNFFEVDTHALETLGLKLIEGRNFLEEEIQYRDRPAFRGVPAMILTRSVATRLFGEETAVGRMLYNGLGEGGLVVGIVDHMMGSYVGSPVVGDVILQPEVAAGPSIRYAVRAEPGRRDSLMREIEQKLSEASRERVITWVRPHSFFIERSYKADARMVGFLTVIIVLMVAVTALGVVGLASFLVTARRKQIGTRRAVGARRVDILRYFMLENWLLTTAGLLVGSVLAFAAGHWLSAAYSLPRLEPGFVLGVVGFLWLLGQLAVLLPARRAASIPPAVATRTV